MAADSRVGALLYFPVRTCQGSGSPSQVIRHGVTAAGKPCTSVESLHVRRVPLPSPPLLGDPRGGRPGTRDVIVGRGSPTPPSGIPIPSPDPPPGCRIPPAPAGADRGGGPDGVHTGPPARLRRPRGPRPAVQERCGTPYPPSPSPSLPSPPLQPIHPPDARVPSHTDAIVAVVHPGPHRFGGTFRRRSGRVWGLRPGCERAPSLRAPLERRSLRIVSVVIVGVSECVVLFADGVRALAAYGMSFPPLCVFCSGPRRTVGCVPHREGGGGD